MRTPHAGAPSVFGVNALAVVGEHLDNPALHDAAVTASLDHGLQLGLKRGQAGDALLHLNQARPRNDVGGHTRLIRIVLQGEKGADRRDLESQLARMTDERQPAQVAVVVARRLPSVRGGAGKRPICS